MKGEYSLALAWDRRRYREEEGEYSLALTQSEGSYYVNPPAKLLKYNAEIKSQQVLTSTSPSIVGQELWDKRRQANARLINFKNEKLLQNTKYIF